MKSLIKEIVIMVLLCVAIILLLALIFYNYLPMGVIVPNKVEAYVTPSEIKNIVNTEIVDYPKENLTFEITDADLARYQRVKSYDPNKSDPFSASTSKTTETNTTSGQKTTTSSSTEKSSSSTSTSSSSKTSNTTSVFDTKIK